MNRVLLSLIYIFGCGICVAQESYTVSGKVRGITLDKVYLVAADFGRADTLASAAVTHDSFFLQGKVAGGVRAVNLIFAGIEGKLPFILEHTLYQVSVTRQGAAIEGEGDAAKLYREFERIGTEYATEKSLVEAEYKVLRDNESRIQSLQVRLENAYNESLAKTYALIKANADNYVSAYVIALGMRTDTGEGLRAKYNILNEAARVSIPGKAIAATLQQHEMLAEGKIAPNFMFSKPDGNAFSLHDISAKWKLLHFWASRIDASRRDNSNLVKLYLQYRPKGLDIISISLDENVSMWKQAIGLDGMIWTNGSDLKGENSEVARLYFVNELPAYILLDAENRIIARNLSFANLRDKLAEVTKRKRKK